MKNNPLIGAAQEELKKTEFDPMLVAESTLPKPQPWKCLKSIHR